MKKLLYISIPGIAIIILMAMCKKAYYPEVSDVETNVLVVEGGINNGDSTIIKLSQTVKLSNTSNTPVVKAVVTVEDDQNATFALTELSAGRYSAAPVTLNNARKYRLRIKTADGQIYLSDAEPVKNAPAIDSVGFTITNEGLAIYADTHDATNNTRYYRWDYEEAWRFHALYDTKYKTDGTSIRPRTDQIYYCYANAISNNIIAGSSAKLTQDVIYHAPIALIRADAEKISIRYSILVKQYALSQAGYEFWSNIKKNTEGLGSIFDAQPSAAIGNIHCISNPDRPVVGYISAGTVQTKRIFIDKSQLPAWKTVYPYDCNLDSLYFVHPVTAQRQVEEILIPLKETKLAVEMMIIGGTLKGYLSAYKTCSDCTIRGKLAAPPFWK